MDEKRINEHESLELITTMIQNARTNLRAKINCNTLLLWGYSTVIMSIIICCIKKYNLFPYSSLLWLVIPLFCYPAMKYLSVKDTTKIKSYLDKVIVYISVLYTAVCTATGIATIWTFFPVYFMEGLLFSMWAAIIGLLIKYKPVVWGGVIGIVISFSLLFIQEETIQIFIFGIIPIFTIIIPGHLFKKSISTNV